MNKTTKNLTLSAMFVALGLLLPFLTGQIPNIGRMLLPMHFPVFLCGLICGWQYGLAVGLIVPIFRSFLFGSPVMFPMAVSMAFELAAYGILTGILYQHSKNQNMKTLMGSIVISMLGGRLVYGIMQVLLLGLGDKGFTWQAYIQGAFVMAIPGIVLQLILLPVIMAALNKTGLVPFKNGGK